ncbi:hypothetical protein HGA91_02480 [candidate division WWE3 bacterium]|nr:hypothetical protein [candidate division WWE3 bacterium]
MRVVHASLFPVANALLDSGRVDAVLVPQGMDDGPQSVFAVCGDSLTFRIFSQLGLDAVTFPVELGEYPVLNIRGTVELVGRVLHEADLAAISWIPSGDDMLVAVMGPEIEGLDLADVELCVEEVI